MRTLEKLEQAIELAEQMGYRIRYEALAGSHGGVCEFSGHRWLFMDLSLSVDERFDLVSEALLADPSLPVDQLSPELRSHLGLLPLPSPIAKKVAA